MNADVQAISCFCVICFSRSESGPIEIVGGSGHAAMHILLLGMLSWAACCLALPLNVQFRQVTDCTVGSRCASADVCKLSFSAIRADLQVLVACLVLLFPIALQGVAIEQ